MRGGKTSVRQTRKHHPGKGWPLLRPLWALEMLRSNQDSKWSQQSPGKWVQDVNKEVKDDSQASDPSE